MINGDGCTSACKIEKGYSCAGGSSSTKDSCTDTCGDGLVVLRSSPSYCDDGNKVNGDGCSQNCLTEHTWTCLGGSNSTRDHCTEVCGDGIKLGGNQCEDDNQLNGDGCSSTC